MILSSVAISLTIGLVLMQVVHGQMPTIEYEQKANCEVIK